MRFPERFHLDVNRRMLCLEASFLMTPESEHFMDASTIARNLYGGQRRFAASHETETLCRKSSPLFAFHRSGLVALLISCDSETRHSLV